jgi:hypothetical protein
MVVVLEPTSRVSNAVFAVGIGSLWPVELSVVKLGSA